MEIVQDFLTLNKFSRPGLKRPKTAGLVVHWVNNPGTSAQFNRDFFQSLKSGLQGTSGDWYASTQYIIGIDGEAIQTMPASEVAYHVGSRTYTKPAKEVFGQYTEYPYSPNYITIGVELCHPDSTGKFTLDTLDSATELFTNLCYTYHLSGNDIYRHFDITGKKCPKYFVDNPEEFEEFKQEVEKEMKSKIRRLL